MPDIVMGQPLSRTEAILQNMLGANNVLEPPMSREEYLLLLLLNQVGPSGNYYTKEEVDNKISALEQEIDWKESVATFADLATTYPDAEAGWTATVLADGRIYRYNGTAWIDIYGMIPLATSSVNGLMSSGKVIDLETVKTLLNGHSVGKDVPSDAKFTDTVYDDTEIKTSVADIDTALSVPDGSGKNKLETILADIKTSNTDGTWSGNAYTINGITFTVEIDTDLNVVGIKVNGTASQETIFNVGLTPATGTFVMSGCPNGGSVSTYSVYAKSLYVHDYGTGANIAPSGTQVTVAIVIRDGYTANNLMFYPMIRTAGTSSEFVPYIPSVEERLSGAENDISDVKEDISDLDTRVTDLENHETDVNVSKTATGNPISITDAADAPIVSGEVTFEPQQDLHGYDKPWVGGAGKNKLPLTLTKLKSDNSQGTWSGNIYTRNNGTFEILVDGDENVIGIKINGTFNAETLFFLATSSAPNVMSAGNYILNGCPSGGSNSTYRLRIGGIGSDTGDGIALTLTATGNANPEIVIANGYIAQNLVFYPMIRLATETDPTFEPYSNICPITGYTDYEVEVTGKNLLQNTATTNTVDGVTYNVNSDGSVAASGTANGTAILQICSKIPIDVLWGTVTLSGMENTTNLIWNSVILYDDSDTVVERIVNQGSGQSKSNKTFNLANYPTVTKISVSIKRLSDGAVGGTIYPQLEVGTEATAYEPYQSTTYTIDLDGTRYGGKVNPVSGVMVVDRACFIGDGSSDENWNITGTGRLQLSDISNLKQYTDIANEYLTCSIAVKATSTANTGVITYSSGKLVLYLEGFKDGTLEDWKTYISNNPVYICYELATPFTVQLTPEQIRILEGTNNISTNMTSMSLDYITQEYQPLVDLAEDNSGSSNDIVHLTQAEYDALPATKESDDKLYLITDTNGDGSQFQPVIYSFEEREIGVWTDGKPLYEKSVNFGTLPNATSKSVAHNISNLGDVCFVNAIANNGSGAYIPIPFVSKSGIQYQLALNITSTDIVINTGDNFTNYSAIATLQYTKATDTPGSGTWTPQGVPALHYSTDEHVIGTWIDDKPLYEKSWNVSIQLPSSSANTWVSTGIEIASVNCDGIAGGELIDDQNQCISGNIGFIQQKTYFAINTQIDGRTITKITIRYTKSTD